MVLGTDAPDHGAVQGVRGTGQNSGVKDEKQWRARRQAWGRSALAIPCAPRGTLRAFWISGERDIAPVPLDPA